MQLSPVQFLWLAIVFGTAKCNEPNQMMMPSQASETGRILFYMPLISKSMKITFMPLAEKLAQRGHEVVVVMPLEAKTKQNNLHVISIKSPIEGELNCFLPLLCII